MSHLAAPRRHPRPISPTRPPSKYRMVKRTTTSKIGLTASAPLVIPGYTGCMKTAISLPDETFERVDKRAASLHLSRSEFFARAAEQYLDRLESSSVTDEIDDAVGETKDDSGRAAVAAGLRRLAESDDEW